MNVVKLDGLRFKLASNSLKPAELFQQNPQNRLRRCRLYAIGRFTFSSMANASSAQASRRVQEAASARPASVGAILRVLRLSSFTPY